MARVESTRNIRHAVRALMPLRPAPIGNRRLVRFLALALVSLLVILLALSLFSAIGASRSVGIALGIVWLSVVSIAAPITLYKRRREEERVSQIYREWASDSRRLAIDRLGLDLAAARLPRNVGVSEILALEATAADWRNGREALEGLDWATGDLAQTRDELRLQMDEAMSNLLAEAGSGCSLGLSPFALERARSLFVEIGREANQLASTNAAPPQFPTDDSIEALRPTLDRLRATRLEPNGRPPKPLNRRHQRHVVGERALGIKALGVVPVRYMSGGASGLHAFGLGGAGCGLAWST